MGFIDLNLFLKLHAFRLPPTKRPEVAYQLLQSVETSNMLIQKVDRDLRSILHQWAIVFWPYDNLSPTCLKLITYAWMTQQSLKITATPPSNQQNSFVEATGCFWLHGVFLKIHTRFLYNLHRLQIEIGLREIIDVVSYNICLYNQNTLILHLQNGYISVADRWSIG